MNSPNNESNKFGRENINPKKANKIKDNVLKKNNKKLRDTKEGNVVICIKNQNASVHISVNQQLLFLSML